MCMFGQGCSLSMFETHKNCNTSEGNEMNPTTTQVDEYITTVCRVTQNGARQRKRFETNHSIWQEAVCRGGSREKQF